MRFLLAVVLAAVSSGVYGQNCKNGQCFAPTLAAPQSSGFNLAPGERLISVGGVPCGPQASSAAPATGLMPYEVNRDQRAYDWAKREATILASRGTAGHPIGLAPGCSRSGTGYSHSNRPNHCFYGELPDSRLRARACVRGRNGALYWSAHY